MGAELLNVSGAPTPPAAKLLVDSSFAWEEDFISTLSCHSFSGV
jgi:hypothetical protein